jgi:hypothetical protein
VRYTVREFEEAVAGAMIRYTHQLDLVMRHALVTGQWTKRMTFKDLTGREQPLPLDPRGMVVEAEERSEESDEEQARGMRAWMAQAEAQIRASGAIKIEGEE